MQGRTCLPFAAGLATIICLLTTHGTVLAYDLTDKFSIDGVIAGIRMAVEF